MPLGSSSAAPVTRPGPSRASKPCAGGRGGSEGRSWGGRSVPAASRPALAGLPASDIQLLHEAGILLNEGEAQLGLAAHELLDEERRLAERLAALAGRVAVGELDLEEGAAPRAHRRLAELGRRHLAEALE